MWSAIGCHVPAAESAQANPLAPFSDSMISQLLGRYSLREFGVNTYFSTAIKAFISRSTSASFVRKT
jgi:hypothetical protein